MGGLDWHFSVITESWVNSGDVHASDALNHKEVLNGLVAYFMLAKLNAVGGQQFSPGVCGVPADPSKWLQCSHYMHRQHLAVLADHQNMAALGQIQPKTRQWDPKWVNHVTCAVQQRNGTP